MKYLYIPTTTLNFNNILSTGSISPATVYSTRRFGYNKFEVVPPNPYQNTLLLYDRYPIFSIVDAERDNHPLVLRIRADRIFEGIQNIRDVQAYDKTIYLDPASTEFIFDSPEANKIALIKAEPSLTTKFIDLYQSRMLVANFTQLDSFRWSLDILNNVSDGSREAALKNCENDERINRLKGFATGYILGAYKSIDEKAARYRSVLKEQRNDISAMLNDPSRRNSDAPRLALESCLALDKFWTKEGVGNRRFDHEHGDKIVNDRGQIGALIDGNESDPKSTLLLRRFFNMYCITTEFVGQLDEDRFNVAFEGAKAIKNLMGSEWENSENQEYINDLLNNIKSGSPFEFNSSSSFALKSFAAFVQKGDDLDKLETYLVDQGIGDFRIAFALWGAMFGFSKIPKTAYNLPALRGEPSYMKKMHNYVHSIVHGIPLSELEEKVSKTNLPTVSMITPDGEASLELIEKIQQLVPDAERWIPSIAEQLKGDRNGFISWLKKAKTADLGGRSKGKMEDVKSDVMRVVSNFFSGELESQTIPPKQPLLNLNQQIKFWEDLQAWEIICNAVPTRHHKELKRDLDWFQSAFKNPNDEWYGWQNKEAKSRISEKKLDHRTNFDAIEALVGLLKRKLERRSRENREFLTESEIERVRCLLSGRYP